MEYDWFEVWTNEATPIPYVLLLLHIPGDPGELLVIDPKEHDRVIFRSPDEEEAKNWLLEDEFTRVDGRLPES